MCEGENRCQRSDGCRSSQSGHSYDKTCRTSSISHCGNCRYFHSQKFKIHFSGLSALVIPPITCALLAGTNILGAIDPLDKIATVASEEKAWFHVDGHLAGSCIFSETQKHRLNGIER